MQLLWQERCRWQLPAHCLPAATHAGANHAGVLLPCTFSTVCRTPLLPNCHPTQAAREEAEREAMMSVDWHDFVVVETIEFYDDELDELPGPMTVKDVRAGGVARDGRLGCGGAHPNGDCSHSQLSCRCTSRLLSTLLPSCRSCGCPRHPSMRSQSRRRQLPQPPRRSSRIWRWTQRRRRWWHRVRLRAAPLLPRLGRQIWIWRRATMRRQLRPRRARHRQRRRRRRGPCGWSRTTSAPRHGSSSSTTPPSACRGSAGGVGSCGWLLRMGNGGWVRSRCPAWPFTPR